MRIQSFLKGRVGKRRDKRDLEALENSIDRIVEAPARHALASRAHKRGEAMFLLDGFVGRYVSDNSGARQLVGIQLPGDWLDLHGIWDKTLDHDVVPLTDASIAVFKHDTLEELFADRPGVMRELWRATLLDGAIQREWQFRLGARHADARVAALVCELVERARLIGRYDGKSFPVPLTQSDFAEACGVSNVHANRTFRSLRERGLLGGSEGAGGLRVLDEQGLRDVAGFRSDYLYADPETREIEVPTGSALAR